MKLTTILTIVVIVAGIYFYTDGGAKLGLNQPKDFPESIEPPNATFMGDAQSNPHFK